MLVPAPVYPALPPDYIPPTLTVIGLVISCVAVVVFVWVVLRANTIRRRHGHFPARLLIGPALVAATTGAVAYTADAAARTHHDHLEHAWARERDRIEAITVAALEDAYDVKITAYWFIPDHGTDRVEVQHPNGHTQTDCTLTAANGALTLHCPPAHTDTQPPSPEPTTS